MRLRHLAGLVAVAMGTLVAAPRLSAPGPAGFYIEPQTGMWLVAVRPGTFQMGSPPAEAGRNPDEQPRTINLPGVFYIGRHEVTQADWKRVMGTNPSHFQGCERCPVETVDFYEVNAFLSRLNAGSSSMRFRLPTEAEWEYACRAGTTTPFGTGAQLTAVQANVDARYPYAGGAPGRFQEMTTPVASFAPNDWGLFDMHGNVWEWTNDWYGPYDPAQTVNPAGPREGQLRVIRGGSWHFDVNSARCALRYTHAPQDKGFSLGFRIVGEPVRSRARR